MKKELLAEKSFTYRIVEKFNVELQNVSDYTNESFDLAVYYNDDTLAPATFEILYNPVVVAGTALRAAVTTLQNSIPKAMTVIEWGNFAGNLWETLKTLVDDCKKRDYTGTFFNALSTLGQTLSQAASTLLEHLNVAPIFNLAGSMATWETKILEAQSTYSNSTVSAEDKQEAIDDVIIEGIGFIGAVIQTAEFFIPMGPAAKTALEIGAAAVVAGVKTAYLKSVHKDKNFFLTFAEQMFEGIWYIGERVVEGIQNLVGNANNSSDNDEALEKNQTLTTSNGTIFSVSTDNVMTIEDNNGNVSLCNLSSTTSVINVSDSSAVYNYSSSVTIVGSDNGNAIYNYGNNITIECKGGNDTVYNTGDNVTIKGVTGQNQIYSTGDNVKVIDLVDGNNEIVTGDGDDTIKVADKTEDFDTRYYDYIDAGDGNNYIYNRNVERSTILSGSGNDTIITGGGDRSAYSPYGYTLINAGNGDNKITINSSLTNGIIYAGDGNDFVTITGNGNYNAISLGGSNDSFVGGVSRSTINVGSGDDSISLNTDSQYNVIWLGSGNDVIRLDNAAGHHTVTGGNGDDSIYSNGIANMFRYTSGEGNDVIFNMSSSDTLVIGSGSGTYSTTNSGNDLIVTAGTGSIRLKNVSKITPKIQGSLTAGNNNTTINNDDTIPGDEGNDTVIAGVKLTNKKGNRIVAGTEYADNIKNTGSNITIFGYEDNDSIVNSASSVSVYGNEGNDTIYSSGTNVLLNGGEDNDRISLSGSGTKNIINAGKGNDTIYSSNANVITYLYAKGDGNDVINGWTAKDTLSITGGAYKLSTVGNNVKVSITGGGAVTLVGAKGMTVNVKASSTAAKLAQSADMVDSFWFDEANFITDDLQLDSITELPATNYSVGKIENSTNYDVLTPDENFITASTR